MRAKYLPFILIFLSAFSLPAAADVSQDDDLPKVSVMACQGQCANFVPAKLLTIERYRFPTDQYGWARFYSEARVSLLYTVGPDGKVRDDIMLLSLIGPREFADAVIEKLRNWTFQPATSDGKPVAQSRTYRVNFEQAAQGLVVRPRVLEVTQGFNSFSELMKQGKTEEARARLEDVLKNVGLRSRDRVEVASALADLAYKRGDYLEARRLAVMATEVTGLDISTDVRNEAWKNRVKADLKLGEIPDALVALAELQKKASSDATLPRLAESIRATADTAPRLTVQGQIPAAEEGDVYTFIPYRRSFTFQNVQGALQKFVLSCNQATMESDIKPEAQWRIPDKWDGCNVYVRGAPGTKFLVVQPKE